MSCYCYFHFTGEELKLKELWAISHSDSRARPPCYGFWDFLCITQSYPIPASHSHSWLCKEKYLKTISIYSFHLGDFCCCSNHKAPFLWPVKGIESICSLKDTTSKISQQGALWHRKFSLACYLWFSGLFSFVFVFVFPSLLCVFTRSLFKFTRLASQTAVYH